MPSPLHDAFVQFFNTHTHCVLRLAAVLGLERGREQGREQGLEQGLRTSLLRVLEARDLSPTPEQRAEIDGCSDIDQLQRWLDRSVRAASVAEVLAPCA